MSFWFVVVLDVNVTEHDPEASVHGLPLKVPPPVVLVEKLTVPVAALGVTVAVHVAGAFNRSAEQVSVVLVDVAACATVNPNPSGFIPNTSSTMRTARAAARRALRLGPGVEDCVNYPPPATDAGTRLKTPGGLVATKG